MLVEGDARLASDPGAVEPHIRRNEWFACCFVDYAASDGMIHRFSDVVPNFRGHFTRLFGDQLRTARKVRAVSTGRCNTGLQFTRRRLKAQGLSRALVETQRDLVEMGLSVD